MMRSNHTQQPGGTLDAVIFDLDDTLISWARPEMSWPDYLAPAMQGMADYLAQVGQPVESAEQLGSAFSRITRSAWADARETHVGVSLAGVLHRTLTTLGLDPAAVDLHQLMHAMAWRPMPGVVAFPDAAEVLAWLRARGLKIGLITNAFQPMWMRDIELESVGLLEMLDARITSGDTGYMKPHPAVFWRMLGLLNTTPDRAMFVGDSPDHDIRGANATGLTSVQICPPHLNKRSDDVTPDHTITTLRELLPIVEARLAQKQPA